MGAKLLNEVTGEASLTDKAGRDYHVVFDMDAVMALEKITGKSAVAIMSDTSNTDCVAMIMCGSAGWQRRNSGSPRLNANLAKRVFIDSGGFAKCAPVLAESLSCAEGMGFDAGSEEDTEAVDDGPLA